MDPVNDEVNIIELTRENRRLKNEVELIKSRMKPVDKLTVDQLIGQNEHLKHEIQRLNLQKKRWNY